jgi:hypothetical protein
LNKVPPSHLADITESLDVTVKPFEVGMTQEAPIPFRAPRLGNRNISPLEDRDAELPRCTNDLDLEALNIPGDHHVIEPAFPQSGEGVR